MKVAIVGASGAVGQEFHLDLFTAEGIFGSGTAFRTEQY